jgi:hypothetical protein
MELLLHFIKEALEVLTISHCILVLITALFSLILGRLKGVVLEGMEIAGQGLKSAKTVGDSFSCESRLAVCTY